MPVGVASPIAVGVSSAIAVGVASAATIGYACTAHCLLRHEGAPNEYSFNIYRRQLYYYKYNRILLCDIQKSKNRRGTFGGRGKCPLNLVPFPSFTLG